MPAAPSGMGVGTLPGGKEFYRACLAWHLGYPNVSAEEVYDLGVQEVNRIKERTI